MSTVKVATLAYDSSESFFDGAAIGLESSEARKEGDGAEKSGEWDTYRACVITRLATLLRCHDDCITLHHNTTAAIQRVFLRLGHLLGGHPLSLLTTDLEYPGVVAFVNENWHGRVVIAEVAHHLWSVPPNVEALEQDLRRILQIAEPDILYVSHVARGSGYVLPIARFVRFARSLNPRIVVIVDGAQAVGNVEVGPEILDNVDAYVTSGHKWLAGRTTLGVVYAQPVWRIADPGQAYSRDRGSGGTGDLRVLGSLAKALTEFLPADGTCAQVRMTAIAAHCRGLAQSFAKGIRSCAQKLDLINPGNPHGSGIVAIRRPPPDLAKHLEEKKFVISHLHGESYCRDEGGSAPGPRFLVRLEKEDGGKQVPVVRRVSLADERIGPSFPSEGVLRVCFHLFHTEQDVKQLVTAIKEFFE